MKKILRGYPHCSFSVIFRCYPFWYADDNDEITLTTSGTFITNPGSLYAKPVITAYGTETITLMVGTTIGEVEDIGSSIVKSSYDTTYYNIVMLDPDGNRANMTGTMWKGGDRIYIDSEYETTVIEALKKNRSVSFRIDEIRKYGSSSYLFKMEDTSFFDNAYAMLK